MPAGELNNERTRRLMGILARENSKTGYFQRTPAVFREMQGDTHKTLPVEDFGPSPDLLPPNFTGPPDYIARMREARLGGAAARRRATSASHFRAPAGPVEYTSVFKPKPGQEHVCNLSKAQRGKVAVSEWALLNTLEVKMANDDKDQRLRIQSARAADQRSHLDMQVYEKELRERQERAEVSREARLIHGELAALKAEEAVMAEAARQRNLQSRADRTSQLEEKQRARLAAQGRKFADEEATLADSRALLDAEKVVAAAKAAAMKAQAAHTRLENEERMQYKKDVLAYQRLADAEMMQANIILLDKRDAERQEAKELFHSACAARSRGASTMALDNTRERLEREARIVKNFEEQKEREYDARSAKDKDRRARHKQELMQAREDSLAVKGRRASSARDETAHLRRVAEAETREEAAAEAHRVAAIRAKALDIRDFQIAQISDREMRSVNDGVGMTEAERCLNMRLLNHATRIVGQPQQLVVKY